MRAESHRQSIRRRHREIQTTKQMPHWGGNEKLPIYNVCAWTSVDLRQRATRDTSGTHADGAGVARIGKSWPLLPSFPSFAESKASSLSRSCFSAYRVMIVCPASRG